MPPSELFHPRHWPTWLVIGFARLIALLPVEVLLALGAGLGQLAYLAIPRRRKITRRNVDLCFPELDAAARAQMARDHFAAAGMGVMELLLCWWASDRKLDGRVQIDGLEHLQQAVDAGKGVVLLSAHFTSLELGTRFLNQHVPLTAMYRPHENPVFRYVMQAGRNNHTDIEIIPKQDVRGLIRALKAGKVVWYAPDQSQKIKFSARLPFFGHPAITNIATPRLARMTGCAVVPYFMYRVAPGRYRLDIRSALADFPSGDDTADSVRINQLFEDAIRVAPEQYLWMHRRFKGVPDVPDPYR